MIARSAEFGAAGFLAFALAHWGCDLVWDYALPALSFKGSQVLGTHFQKGVFLLSGVCLVVFGRRFIVDGAVTLFS